MGDVKKSIKWMEDHHRTKGNYPYSMVRRNLNPGTDCSSSIHYALIAGGFLPKTAFIGNTETLFALARKGKVLKEIYSYDEVQPGDIFIRGGEGTSLGARGHTGMFYKKDGIIHSNYTNNGISKNDLNSHLTYYIDRKRSANERYFRPIPQEESKPIKKKSVAEIASEVIEGKWGVGQDRVRKLENAGYSYRDVQNEVNRQLREKSVYYTVKSGDSPKPKKDSPKKETTSQSVVAGARKVKNEKWHGYTTAYCNVRSGPSTASSVVAQYAPGQVIKYDQVWEGNGYRWISYVGGSGKRRWVAYRRTNGNTKSWIKF